MAIHIPVLLKETIEALDPKQNENFVDCTAGEGGHTAAILEKNGPNGKVLAIDWDKNQAEAIKRNIKSERLVSHSGNYADIKEIAKEIGFGKISGILMDLGMSSVHIEISEKGFSFQKDEPLDMRYSEENELTAKDIINSWKREELIRIFEEYGEEKHAKKIADKIIDERKVKEIKSTLELANIISRAVKSPRERINPATRVFQALRMAVNDELGNLKRGLADGFEILEYGGRMVIISFHSGEDRIVKNFFKELINKNLAIELVKKPVMAKDDELKINIRARSAKLRAIQKI